MRPILTLLLCGTLLPVAATAQAPADFSGTWKINMSKSDPPPQGRGGMQQVDQSRIVLTITQTADMVTIVRSGGQMDLTTTYYLDGRESTNRMGRGEMKSTSRWDGAKLITEGAAEMETPMGAMSIETTETRELSADGKQMTVTVRSVTPRGTRTQKTVFDRQ